MYLFLIESNPLCRGYTHLSLLNVYNLDQGVKLLEDNDTCGQLLPSEEERKPLEPIRVCRNAKLSKIFILKPIRMSLEGSYLANIQLIAELSRAQPVGHHG